MKHSDSRLYYFTTQHNNENLYPSRVQNKQERVALQERKEAIVLQEIASLR